MTRWMWTIEYGAVISSWQPAASDCCQLLWWKSPATSLMKDTESLDTEQVWPADSHPWYKLKSKLASYFQIACFSSKKSNDKVGFSIKVSPHCIPSSHQDFSVLSRNTSICEHDKGVWHTCMIRTIIFVISNNKAIIDVPQLRLPANTEWTTTATNGQQKRKKDIRRVNCQWQLRDCIMQALLSTRNTSWIFFITSRWNSYSIHLVCTLQFFSIKSWWLFTVTFRFDGLPQG